MAGRSANFSQREVEELLNCLEANPQLLKGVNGEIPSSKEHFELAWKVVAQKVNAVYPGTERTPEQMRKKWYDLKSRVRMKVSKLAHKNIENKRPLREDKLTWLDRRTLSLVGEKDRTVINRQFDSAITIKLLPANTLHSFVVQNTEETDSTNLTENNAIQEISNYSHISNVVAENLDEIETDEANAANQASGCDWSNQIIIQEVQTESQERNASNAENAAVEETSDCNWPYLPSRLSYISEANKSRKARKRKQLEEEEFERKAIKTQERMANDINEIKLSMIQMKDHMKTYIERIDKKFDRMLDLLAVALNVEPEELNQ